MKILCTICARSGSKGVKDKNIRNLLDKPLIAYTIETAKQWNGFTDLICSTDGDKIAEVAQKFGAKVYFKRPEVLANDTAGKVGVVRHALEEMEKIKGYQYDYVVDLDATSPFREVQDIENAVKKCIDEQLDIVFSVCKARKNPYFNMVELDENGYAHLCKQLNQDVLSRQKAPAVYELNASIYVYERSYLLEATTVYAKKAGIIEMADYAIDIDNEEDLEYANWIMAKKHNCE